MYGVFGGGEFAVRARQWLQMREPSSAICICIPMAPLQFPVAAREPVRSDVLCVCVCWFVCGSGPHTLTNVVSPASTSICAAIVWWSPHTHTHTSIRPCANLGGPTFYQTKAVLHSTAMVEGGDEIEKMINGMEAILYLCQLPVCPLPFPPPLFVARLRRSSRAMHLSFRRRRGEGYATSHGIIVAVLFSRKARNR